MPEFSALVRSFDVRPAATSLSRGYWAECWSPPGVLAPAHREALYRTLVEISTSAFGADMTPYWRDRARDGYLDQITRFYLVRSADDRIVGWTGYHRFHVERRVCLYLDSTGMLPELQRTGVMTRLYGQFLLRELARNYMGDLHLTMRTENPIVYQAFSRIVGEENIFPNPAAPPPPHVQNIGRFIIRWLKQADKFDAGTLRVRGAYDNLDALYGELPHSSDDRLNRYFQQHLRADDAFIVVARMDWRAGAKVLFKVLNNCTFRRAAGKRAATT